MAVYGSARYHEGVESPYARHIGPRPTARSGAGSGTATAAIDPGDTVTLSGATTIPGGDPDVVPVDAALATVPASGTNSTGATAEGAKREGVRDETDFRIYRVLTERGLTHGARWNVSVDSKPAMNKVLEEALADGKLTKGEWEKLTGRTWTDAAWHAFTFGKGAITGKEGLADALETLERNLDVPNLEAWQFAEEDNVTIASADGLSPMVREKFDQDRLNVPFRAVFLRARSEAEGTIQRQRVALLNMRGMSDEDIREDLQEYMEKDEVKRMIDNAAAVRVQHEVAYILSQKSISVEIPLSDPLVFELYTQPGGLFERAITEVDFPDKKDWDALGEKLEKVKAFRAWVNDSNYPERKEKLGGLLAQLDSGGCKGCASMVEEVLENYESADLAVTENGLIDALAMRTPVDRKSV